MQVVHKTHHRQDGDGDEEIVECQAVGEGVEQHGEVEDDAGTEEGHTVVRAALVGPVDDMETFGCEKIEQLKGNDCYGGNDKIHISFRFVCMMQKYNFFLYKGIFSYFCNV